MKTRLYSALALSFMLMLSCNTPEREGDPQAYSVLSIVRDSLSITEAYSASIRGRQDIDIFPQVAGKIVRVCVHEGQKVGRGDLLFVIDRVPFEAALRTAVANVHAAEATLETARLEEKSKALLYSEKVISEYELSAAKNALALAEAGLELAEAQAFDARNSLSYTEVRSPSDGVVGILPHRVGTLVNPAMTSPLTSVSDNQSMHVYFSMTENQLRALVRQYGTLDKTISQMPPIRLELSDGTIYDLPGRVESISGVIHAQTGTVSLRSAFPNPKRLLFSGGIGKVLIPHIERDRVIIPQSATYDLQNKIYVYRVVDGKSLASEITVTPLNDGLNYAVKTGLSVGDIIVSEGVGLLQDGMDIHVKKNDERKEQKK